MKPVKQEGFGQCGAACLATVLGDPLDLVVAEVEAKAEARLADIGMADGEMVEHLRQHGLSNARIILDWDGSEPAILTVPSLNYPGLLHYVVWDGAYYLDPSRGAFLYPRDAPVIGGEKMVCWATAIVWDREES